MHEHKERLTLTIAVPLKASKNFCSFCGDLADEAYLLECIECWAKMCQQSVRSGPGCIEFDTVKADRGFLCLVCDGKRARRLVEGAINGDQLVPRIRWEAASKNDVALGSRDRRIKE
ncbi:hypothetical protein J3R83DRAFT_10942 [Lanmaoa asiatica]|nr:hypothetical protein J3R83DRAFT_10942 [Lanmaoa asiatica]